MNPLDLALRLLFADIAGVGLLSCFQFARPYLAKRFKKLALKDIKSVSAVCKDGSCIQLERTKWGRLFGFPNWWLGIAFYTLTLLSVIWTNPWIVTFAIIGSLTSVLVSIVLMYGLMVKLRAVCFWCYVSHAVNIALLVLWCIAIIFSDQLA